MFRANDKFVGGIDCLKVSNLAVERNLLARKRCVLIPLKGLKLTHFLPPSS